MGANQEDDEDDPFACFDSSDDDESDNGEAAQVQALSQEQPQIIRDPGNGVLAFHAGTEVALLHHVKTELAPKNNTNASLRGIQATIQQAQSVLDIVDSYCLSRHWMMHVGPEKAGPLRKFIGDSLAQHQKDGMPFTIVELGTYCGYSSVFIAKTVLEHCVENGNATEFSFHIYSVEVVEKFASVAKELIQLAGMEEFVSVLLVKDPEEIAAAARMGENRSLASELKRHLPNEETATIDFLFVDHDKSLYLPNLQELERANMIKSGTHVAADNVVFAQIQDYRAYMAQLADQNVVSTRLAENLFVEYCQPELSELEANGQTASAATKDMMRDGIEFSVYLRDPPNE